MLLTEVVQLVEMARPAKICVKCKKPMAGYHYWYKGGWCCKKKYLPGGEEAKEEKKDKKLAAKTAVKKGQPKKEAPKKPPSDDEDEREHKGVVRGMEREAGEERDPDVAAAERAEKAAKKKKVFKAGETITAADMRDIDADTEAEARSQINSLFPKATDEHKKRALNVWKARHKKKD